MVLVQLACLPPPFEPKKSPKPAAKDSKPAPDDANDPPEPGSRDDVILTEAQHILADYVDLQRVDQQRGSARAKDAKR